MTMLDRMRRHRGWLKWSLAIVVVSFILLYIPSFMNDPTQGAANNAVVADVEGREITAAQFRRVYQQQMQQQYRRPEDEFGDDEELDTASESDDAQPDIGERPAFAGEAGEQPESFDQGEPRRDYQQANRGHDQQGERRDRHDRRDRFRPRWDRNRGEGQEQGRYGQAVVAAEERDKRSAEA